jgi:hypothetical protein
MVTIRLAFEWSRQNPEHVRRALLPHCDHKTRIKEQREQ